MDRENGGPACIDAQHSYEESVNAIEWTVNNKDINNNEAVVNRLPNSNALQCLRWDLSALQNPTISDDVTVPAMSETLGPPQSVGVPPTLQTATVITAQNLPPTAGQIEIQTPPEAVADKVMFLFNNMSMSNVSEKAKELIDAVPSEYAPWVAQYMVMKRVSAEPNFHSLFVQLIDCLTFPEFPNIVLQQVFRNIKVSCYFILRTHVY